MSAQLDSKCAIDMSGGCGTRQIPNVHTRKPAFIPRTKACRKPSKLPPCCCSSRTIQRSLAGGPFRMAWRLRPTARYSPVRSASDENGDQIHAGRARRRVSGAYRCAHWSQARRPDGAYRLTTGRMRFLVGYKFVRVISHRAESTCFSVAADPDMPRGSGCVRITTAEEQSKIV